MRSDWLRRPSRIAELFAIGNIGFLAVDVWVAHSVNRFAEREEWIPIVFSLTAPIALIAAFFLRERKAGRVLGFVIGWLSLAVGVAGMLFHLKSHFFDEETLKSLVYTAPFVAPLAYAGLGLLLIMNRMVADESRDWPRWIIILALGGFAGNFVLSLADHAQNGFFNINEWVPVVASALALGFLTVLVFRDDDRLFVRAAAFVMVLEMIVGGAGFALHLRANMHAPAQSLWERFLYGAPIFAPLLFPNLAILALIGIWEMSRRIPVYRRRPRLPLS